MRRGRARHALRALRARARPQPRRRRARPAADRHRRLERRHEPRRRARARARASGSAGSCTRRSRRSRRSPRRAASATRAARWRAHAGALAAALERDGLGRRLVSARATSTTARRSARPRATSAGSTRSRSPGRCSPARRDPARAAQAMAAVDEHLVRRDDGLALLFTPPFDTHAARSRLHQGLPAGHPRERRPVHPRRDLGGHRLRRARATATRPRELFSLLNPINHARTRGGRRTATRSSPTSSPPTSTPSPPHVGRGGWTWYTGSAGWMYRAGIECDPRLPPAGRVAAHRPLHPARPGRASRSSSATAPRATRSRSRTRTASAAASQAPRWTATHFRRVRHECPWWMTVRATSVRVILG